MEVEVDCPDESIHALKSFIPNSLQQVVALVNGNEVSPNQIKVALRDGATSLRGAEMLWL